MIDHAKCPVSSSRQEGTVASFYTRKKLKVRNVWELVPGSVTSTEWRRGSASLGQAR